MEKIIVFNGENKVRLDNFLKKEIFLDMKTPRAEIIRQIKTGNILLNGKKTKPSCALKAGDEISVEISEEKDSLAPNRNVKFVIVFQNQDIIVIDKPAGLQVHPSARRENDTLVNGLLSKFPEIANVGDAPEVRPGIVHRLDRGTSGILVVARNQETYLRLKKKFKDREMKKIYQAAVYGVPEKKGIIDAPLARAANYKKQIIAGGRTKTKIRTAVTEYVTLGTAAGLALVEVFPKTGRTHQIRVHLSSIGHPIVGDEKYAQKKFADETGAKRLMLHARKLEFELGGKKYRFEAPLPSDFQAFLEKNGLSSKGLTKRG